MKDKIVYWKLASANIGDTECFGLFFSDEKRDFEPNGDTFSRGCQTEKLTEESKVNLEKEIRIEVNFLNSNKCGLKWIEVKNGED